MEMRSSIGSRVHDGHDDQHPEPCDEESDAGPT